MTLQGYYNRFNSSDNYDELLFRASRGLQSAELNEIQAILSDRIQRIANVLFTDGAIVRDAGATIDAATGEVQMAAGAIYVKGAIREVAAATFTIPTSGVLSIGVYLTEAEVTELEDPALRDPAPGTRNYNEAGAGRRQVSIEWGFTGDGKAGDYYKVYSVENAALVTQSAPPQLDSVTQLIARYDRDANGNYAVRGLQTISEGADGNGNYGYTITDGVANVLGFKVDKPAATRKTYAIDPDLFTVNNEPKTSTGPATQTVSLNYGPLASVDDVVCTLEKTVTLTHGAFTGALDALPDTAVLSIQTITQGATTYTQGTDYVLTGDQVDWSPAGNEPAPGSTYSVTYQYLDSVQAESVDLDDATFDVTGAVAGSLILIDYKWKLPRYDILSLDKAGNIYRIKGVPSRFTPVAPAGYVPSDQLALASIYYNWRSDHTPVVKEIGTRVTSMEDMRKMKESINNLYDLIAIERLNSDLSSREPTAKYGTFAEPFNDNDLRDTGVAQTAVVVANELRPRVLETLVEAPDNNEDPAMLTYTEESVLDQSLLTAAWSINASASFEPVTGGLTLVPPYDNRTVIKKSTSVVVTDVWVNDSWVTYRFDPFWYTFTYTYQAGNVIVTQPVVTYDGRVEYMRSRSLRFKVPTGGFKAGETVQSVFFAGRPVTPNAFRTADSRGRINTWTTITIPNDIPAGTVVMQVIGDQGSVCASYYTGHTDARNIWKSYRNTQINGVTVIRPGAGAVVPVAQTFTLTEDRQLTSLDLKFFGKGSTGEPVLVQLVQTENGIPNNEVLTSGVIHADDIVTNNAWVNAAFYAPTHLRAGQEYAIVIQTDDPDHAVAVAELGGFDTFAGTYVSTQPYTVGTLLTSANASSWVTHTALDLTFRLNGAVYDTTTRTLDMGSFAVSNMSDLAAVARAYLPSEGTAIRFRYTRTTGETFELEPGIPINFQATISDTLQVQAVLAGTSKLSPVLYPGVESAIGRLDTTADYQSREFALNSTGSTLKVFLEAKLSGTAAVVVKYRDGSGTFQAMNLAGTTQVGEGWVEYAYEVAAAGLTATALRLELTGTPQFRPSARALRAVYV